MLSKRPLRRFVVHASQRAAIGLAIVASVVTTLPAMAQPKARIENEIAVFAALDKVTARISRLEVAVGQTVQFGSLKVTPRVCYSRPPTELPKTTSFVEVEDVKLDGAKSRVFTGWMFAESPGLNAVEHPVFDVWLTDCVKPVGQRGAVAGAKQQPGDESDRAPAERRRRVRR